MGDYRKKLTFNLYINDFIVKNTDKYCTIVFYSPVHKIFCCFHILDFFYKYIKNSRFKKYFSPSLSI